VSAMQFYHTKRADYCCRRAYVLLLFLILTICVRPIISKSSGPIDLRHIFRVSRTVAEDDQYEVSFFDLLSNFAMTANFVDLILQTIEVRRHSANGGKRTGAWRSPDAGG